jgi:hypothetical protein
MPLSSFDAQQSAAKAAACKPMVPAEMSWEQHEIRQRFEISAVGLQTRSQQLQVARKFSAAHEGWQPCSYAGYAIVSLLRASVDNSQLEQFLLALQHHIEVAFPCPKRICMLPAHSFHQTIANTFSDERLLQHLPQESQRQSFPQRIAEAMHGVNRHQRSEPLCLRVLGLGIFRSAFGVLLSVPRQQDYDEIIYLRDHVYTHPALRAVGLCRTRPFVAHISLGYIEAEFTEAERIQFSELFSDLNAAITHQQLFLYISSAQLSWYDDLSTFQIQPSFPQYHFVTQDSEAGGV